MNSSIVLSSLLAALCISGYQCENLIDVLGECSKQYPSVPQDVVMKVLSHDYDLKTRDEMCLVSCALKKSKLITNGEIDVNGWDIFHSFHWKDEALREVAHKNTLACKQEAADEHDPCKYAGKVFTCFTVKNKKNKVPPPNTSYA